MDYDYVIVGAGSAGAVLAARLSAHPATQVALIEIRTGLRNGAVARGHAQPKSQ